MVKLSLRCTKTGSGQFIGDMPAYYQTIRNYERRREKKKEIITSHRHIIHINNVYKTHRNTDSI